MTYEILTVRCRSDNYAFVIANMATGDAALIDVPDAAPINEIFVRRPELTLKTVLITHHHGDHVDGLSGLASTGLAVIGCKADAFRLPELTQKLSPGDTISVLGTPMTAMAADGHTLNHVAFYFPNLSALFSGDSLMTHGCGRLFEGTPAQMFQTITAFGRLPDETRIYSGHDYADANIAFAKSFAPEGGTLQDRLSELNKLSEEECSTTGTTLAQEKKLNPYLRVHLPEVKSSVGLPDASDLAVFTEIRKRKDSF